MDDLLKKYYTSLEYKVMGNYLAVTSISRRTICLNSSVERFSDIAKEIIVAHECAHIIIKTLEHILLWEKTFFDLVRQLREQHQQVEFNKILIKLLTMFPHKKNGKFINGGD